MKFSVSNLLLCPKLFVIRLKLSEDYQQRRPLDKCLLFAQIAVSKLAIGANSNVSFVVNS